MEDEWMNVSVSHQVFLLWGFPGISHYRSIFFIPFFTIYLMAVMSNGVMTYIILVDKTLHAPMYVLIALLFSVNISYTNTIMPKFLLGLIFDLNEILLTDCLVQMFFTYLSGSYESHILVLMGLDRYVAITLPLHYHHIMTKRKVAGLLLCGFLRSLLLVSLIIFFASKVQFCKSNIIMNISCENMSLLILGCGDISKVQVVGLWARIIIITMDGTCVLASYVSILRSVMKTTGVKGREKAWRTCSTHLLVTILTFSCGVTSSAVYRMSSLVPLDVQNFVSLMNFAIPTSADPVIYGLRMTEVRNSLTKLYNRRKHGAWA